VSRSGLWREGWRVIWPGKTDSESTSEQSETTPKRPLSIISSSISKCNEIFSVPGHSMKLSVDVDAAVRNKTEQSPHLP
jgi:hypothetical protein